MTLTAILSEELQTVKDRKSGSKWTGSTFEAVKDASMTVKGDFGETVVARTLTEELGIPAEIKNKGKGEFDILLSSGVTIENKLATEDTNNAFQFNGIKLDVAYDFVFCLGISPESVQFAIVPKGDFKKFGSFVPMTKNGDDSYKLTVRKDRLTPFNATNLKAALALAGVA